MILNKTCKKIIQAGLIKYLRCCKDSTKLLFCLIIRFLGNVLPARKAKLPRSWHYVAKLYPDFIARIIHIFPSQYPTYIFTYLVIIIIYFLVWRFEQRRHILWCTVITKSNNFVSHWYIGNCTRKNANLEQTCSNYVPTTCQQDVFVLLVPSLLTSCQRLLSSTHLLQVVSTPCYRPAIQQVVSDNLIETW
jgi:hypothetical protein